MINWAKMQKSANVLIFSFALSMVLFSQIGKAANLNATFDNNINFAIDYYHASEFGLPDDNNLYPGMAGFGFVNHTFFPLALENHSTYSNRLSFIGFNVSNSILRNQSLGSAFIDLYGFGTGSVDVYYVANNDWVNNYYLGTSEPSLASMLGITATNPTGNLIAHFDTNNNTYYTQTHYTPHFTNLSFLQTAINNNQQFSVALVQHEATADISIQGYTSYFSSDVSLTAEAPVPEPSSIIMGIMGLGSIMGFRRNKIYSGLVKKFSINERI